MLILAALAGQRAFKVLQAQQKKNLLAQLDSDGQPLPEEFTKQWSDAELSQLMLALKHLFTYVAAAACGAAKKVRLLLEADLCSGEVTAELILI